jgi:hypothetical protein
VLANLCTSIREGDALESIKSKELSISIWGLQSMSSTQVPETSSLLAAINNALARRKSFSFNNAGEVALLLGGMKNMNLDDKEVLRLLRHVHQAIAATEIFFKSSRNVYSFEKLKKFGVKEIEISHWTDLQIASCFYGLQNMSNESIEVSQIIRILIQLIQNIPNLFSGRSIATILYGLFTCLFFFLLNYCLILQGFNLCPQTPKK